LYSNNTAATTTIIGESSFSDSLSIADGFSDSKKKILWYIKVMQQAGLEELSKVLKISRMAVHKHLNILLKKGFVEPIHIREGKVGRPKIFYQLTRNSKSIFPRSYSTIASSAFDYIEKENGKRRYHGPTR
jgi:predicted ArsR family transcriptional regulator